MGQKNIIEVNGKKYDAQSGALLGESRIKATPASRMAAGQHRGRAIDGFVGKGNHSAALAPNVIKPSPKTVAAPKGVQSLQAKKVMPAGKNFDIQRVPKSNAALKPHQPERPKTLMRHVVKKPLTDLKPSMKTTAPAEIMAKPKSTIARPLEKKLSVSQVNPIRLAHSRHIAKSHHIRRFSKDHQAVAVTASAQRPNQYAGRATRQDFRPAISAAPQTIITQKSSAAVAATKPLAKEPAADIFEAALAHATSHEEKTPQHAKYRSSRHRRMVNVLAGIGAFLLIGGFAAYMNLTNIEVRIASVHAGFHAQLPHYAPTGYALTGGVEAKNGTVAMNYRSGDSLYTITQEASDWNSSTLLDQTSTQNGKPTQTIQSAGRTIYIYNDANATWVNGGVRYQVTGNAPLSADELTSLATSM